MSRYYSAIIEIDRDRFKNFAQKHQQNIGFLEAQQEIEDTFANHNISKEHGHYKGNLNTGCFL